MQHLNVRSFVLGSLVSLAALMFTACGGGGSSSTSAGTGSVAIAMTDGAAEEFDEINVNVVKIELFSDSGHVTVFKGDKTFNLLDLADEARVFAIRNGVPAGSYSKIRLTLTEIELIKRDTDGNIVEREYPKLPGNGKLDLNPRGDFTVYPGETLVLQIDMDANKSIHLHSTGSGKYQFRPVVFVDVMTKALFDKLVRVHGVIRDIDPDDQEFKLCNTDIPVRIHDDREDHDSLGCLQVDVVDGTSIFDAEGQPAEFADLRDGEEATVYGEFRREDHDDDDDSDDRGDDLYLHELDDLELVAVVVELGSEGAFQQLDGVAQSTVDVDDRFTLTIDPGQGFVAGTEVSVQLQPGTKILNRYGDPLDVSEIDAGVPMMVDGVLDIAVDPDVLYAALIIIDTDAARVTTLSGELGLNPDEICGFNLVTAEGDRSIRYDADTRAYLVSDSSSEQVAPGELPPGLSADVYGVPNLDGCFDAETVIAFQ